MPGINTRFNLGLRRIVSRTMTPDIKAEWHLLSNCKFRLSSHHLPTNQISIQYTEEDTVPLVIATLPLFTPCKSNRLMSCRQWKLSVLDVMNVDFSVNYSHGNVAAKISHPVYNNRPTCLKLIVQLSWSKKSIFMKVAAIKRPFIHATIV